MKVFMYKFEKLALDFAKPYKAWELQIVAKDSYMAGYRQALLDANNTIEEWEGTTTQLEFHVGQDTVEVDLPNGAHQLIDDISRVKPSTEELEALDELKLSDSFLKEV